MIDRNALMAQRPRRTQRVELPEFGTYLFVRALNVPEMGALHAAMHATEDRLELAALQISAFAIDDSGNRVFAEDEARKFASSSEWQVCHRIILAGNKLNSLDDEAVETARGN